MNEGPNTAKTMMVHSPKKEASPLLCAASRCRIEDSDVPADDWKDSNGVSLAADRYWTERGAQWAAWPVGGMIA